MPKRPTPPYNPGVGQLIDRKRAGAEPLSIDDLKRGFRGWHENGYLPHRDEPGLTQFVTFRLADAFPTALRSEWEHLLHIENDRKRRIELERYLDRGRGECWLRNPEITALVEQCLLHAHGTDYELLAWVIMPNHVHVLFGVNEVPMSECVNTWKGVTAKRANRILRRRGQFWQDNYWDTYMRDLAHEQKSRRYIENNPVNARLASEPQRWNWSSARRRDAYGRPSW